MARRVFFSFHYDRDCWRVSIVRNCWVVDNSGEAQPFYDAAEWEQIKRQGNSAIKRWIDEQLTGTSVTVVLIGAETATRPWVKYEIERSYELGKGLLGIYIHGIRDNDGSTDFQGANPFANVYVPGLWGTQISLRGKVGLYNWVQQDGRKNIAWWIEQAARQAGR